MKSLNEKNMIILEFRVHLASCEVRKRTMVSGIIGKWTGSGYLDNLESSGRVYFCNFREVELVAGNGRDTAASTRRCAYLQQRPNNHEWESGNSKRK